MLASTSPRRRELLERVGYEVVVLLTDLDESVKPDENVIGYTRRVALDKANHVQLATLPPILIAADTAVSIDGCIFGKPTDEQHAKTMLLRLAARQHQVTTALVVRSPNREIVQEVTTLVCMSEITERELGSYLASGEWRGKAGGYAVQGMAASLVTRIDGSISNVVGLPLFEVITAIVQLGGPPPNYRRGHPA